LNNKKGKRNSKGKEEKRKEPIDKETSSFSGLGLTFIPSTICLIGLLVLFETLDASMCHCSAMFFFFLHHPRTKKFLDSKIFDNSKYIYFRKLIYFTIIQNLIKQNPLNTTQFDSFEGIEVSNLSVPNLF